MNGSTFLKAKYLVFIIIIILLDSGRCVESKAPAKFSKLLDGVTIQCSNEAADKRVTLNSEIKCVSKCWQETFFRCLRIQYYPMVKRCDMFGTWDPFSKDLYDSNSNAGWSGPCQVSQKADLCPKPFTFFPKSKSCFSLEAGSFNWGDARSHCNNIVIPASAYPAVLNTSDRNDDSMNYLTNLNGTENLENCFSGNLLTASLGIWLGGQTRLNNYPPSGFQWKPRPGEAYDFSFIYWKTTQPNYYYPPTMGIPECCLSYFYPFGGFMWADMYCSDTKCVLCQTEPALA